MPHGAGFVTNFAFKGKILKNTIRTLILAVTCAVGSAQAAWDAKYLPEPTGLNYLSDFYLDEGAVRTVKQLKSFDQPNSNGFLYIEQVTEYNCESNAYQVVESRGFRSWDDFGVHLKNNIGVWQPVQPNTNDHTVINRLCRQGTMADAKKYMN